MGPLIFLAVLLQVSADSVKQLYKSEGDVNLALFLHGCKNTTPFLSQSLISSAVWTTQRLDFLELLDSLKLGIAVYETCTEKDEFRAIFDLFLNEDEKFFLGIVTNKQFSTKIQNLCNVLNLRVKTTIKDLNSLIHASLELLSALNMDENASILAPNDYILREYFEASMQHPVCIKDYFVYQKHNVPLKNTTGPIVVFGENSQLSHFLKNVNQEELNNSIFVPVDGSVLTSLPLNSFILQPPHSPNYPVPEKIANILPTPLLFEVASPIISYVQHIRDFLRDFCNQTSYKINCLRSEFRDTSGGPLSPSEILQILKIEPLRSNFVYNIFRINNGSYKSFSFSYFDKNLTVTDPGLDVGNMSGISGKNCKIFGGFPQINYSINILKIRSESWVFAFLSMSLLGVLFCIAILIFLLLSIWRRDILEGNPVLTVLLLIAVMLMFCSVLPFSLESNKFNKNTICTARSLAVTLSFAGAFSLILSRCILLATASKEIGFMSHISGSVQSFLCLFIFGVQAALSLQVAGKCTDIFQGYSFIYLLSYNAMLLLLLLCLCPLIYKCQRNYREGKYFTIATCLITAVWGVWILLYAALGQDWKDPILCFGLVSTGIILIGTIFVPRTYLMTIAAERDKITSALPSLATTDTMDIYRAGTQPVYDCVNVAAINAVAVARAGLQHSNLYTCPDLVEDFGTDNSTNNDKVTRF